VTEATSALVIGIGNDWRGDDGMGLVVARRIRDRRVSGVTVTECAGDAAALLATWRDRSLVILVDAMISGDPPGTVRRIDPLERGLALRATLHSTHALGIADAIGLGTQLGMMPRRLVIYAVEAGDVGYGMGLSAEVDAAIEPLIERILAETRRTTAVTCDT
jgi:hydrogenase maturation protease